VKDQTDAQYVLMMFADGWIDAELYIRARDVIWRREEADEG
jgi:hypothetical protein